jgi:hypothetical protein
VNELIEMAEKAGQENMRERIEVAGVIEREANTVLALLLAGAGAALAYAGGDTGRPGIIGAAIAVCVYLFALAAVLNWKCLGLVAYPAAFNEPGNLLQPEYRAEQVRRWELENLQERISAAVTINTARARWLNGCRYAAALTPVAAAIGWGAAYLVAAAAPAAAALAAG